MVLVDADAVVTHSGAVFELIQRLVIHHVRLRRIEQVTRNVHPDAVIPFRKVLRQIAVRHQMKHADFHDRLLALDFARIDRPRWRVLVELTLVILWRSVARFSATKMVLLNRPRCRSLLFPRETAGPTALLTVLEPTNSPAATHRSPTTPACPATGVALRAAV